MASTLPNAQAESFGAASRVCPPVLGVQILGTGSYAPPRVAPNEELTELGCDPEWIIQRTGIRERRYVSPGVATSDLAYEAARRCLEQAEVAPNQLDMIIVGTMTPDTPTPSTACHLQRRLGGAAAAFDINSACAGFIYSLATGMQFLRSGAAQRVLVVGADIMSRIANPRDEKTYPLFGDGAGAVLLGAGAAEQGCLAYTLGADGQGADLLVAPAGGSREPISHDVLNQGRHYLVMNGRPVFKWAVRLVADTILNLLAQADLKPQDLDLIILHQANIRIIEAAVQDFQLNPEKIFVNVDRYGNTSAASIPLALDEANRQGRLRRGDLVLMCGFGAGLSWGAAVFRW